MKKGFTLVELLAVIIVLSLVLTMGVIKISNVINESKDKLFIDNAKTILSSAEQEYWDRFVNKTLDQVNDPIECSDIFNYTKNEYRSCSINFVNEKAYITLKGNNKFDNRYICGKDKNNIAISNVECDQRESEESNGTIVNINNMNLSDNELHIMGNSIQNGTPTPESRIPVVSFGEDNKKIKLKTTGKNLLQYPYTSKTGFYQGLNINDENGILMFNGTATGYSTFYLNDLELDAGTYTISSENYGSSTSTSNYVLLYAGTTKGGKNIINASFKNKITFNIAEKTHVYFCIKAYTGLVYTNLKIGRVQLEKGSNASSYETYKEKSIDISLTGHEPLRCIGDVCDYINYNTGEIVRKIGSIVFNGTEDLSYTGYTNCFGYKKFNLRAIGTSILSNFGISKLTTEVVASERNWGLLIHNIKENGFAFAKLNSDYTAYNDFKNYLEKEYENKTPVIVYYVLDSSNFIPERIILPNIEFFEGTNNISVTDGNISSNIKLINYLD